MINRTLTINMHPNRSQKGLLKRWMELTRIAYNAVVAWNRKRCFFNVDRQKQWLKHQTFEKKCELYSNIEDEDLRKKCVWGERKFLRTVVRIRLSLQGYLNEVPANIIDETVDEALFARANVIKKNAERGDEEGVSRLSFKSKKDLKHTLTIRRQNFSKRHWNHFYVPSRQINVRVRTYKTQRFERR